MSIFKSFIPFIVYSLVNNWFDWRIGIAVGLLSLIAVVLTTPSRRLGVLGWAQLIFLVVAGAFAVVEPDSGIQNDLNAIGMAWIALASAVTILLGRPFTLDYSAPGEDPAVVASELFQRINRTIAWVWTACFAACAAVGFATTAMDRSTLGTILSVVILVGAIKFTVAYPDKAIAAATGARTSESDLAATL